MANYPGRAFVKPQARGIVLISGSSRNPIASVLCPLILAVAAGNGVVILPFEAHLSCFKVIHKFVRDYLDNRYYTCLERQSEHL